MRLTISSALCSLLVAFMVCHCEAAEKDKVYVKEWALRVEGGERVVRDVAEDHGFEYVRKIGNMKDLYTVRHAEGRRSVRRADMTELLSNDPRVLWVEQQHINEHHKRDYKPLPTVLPPDETGADDQPLEFNDPLFSKQWYLFSKGQNGATKGIDMNTMPAWKLGITGFGVVVSIIDDGVDPTHPDLAPNFDMDASHDFQNGTHKNDANPHPDDSEEAGSKNDHGTKCAGEVAAAANNSVCGVGVAYDASIGGMRVLDGDVTDSMEAAALTFNNQHIDIYSCCWGPPDDGNNFRKPHKLTSEALETGVNEGRGGKGSIFVWASGNGGDKDDCSADGYVSNIRTISIGAINDQGLSTYFMESCPSTLAVVVSGGPHSLGNYRRDGGTLNLVVTTDLHHECTDKFVGTSSSAPLASGVMALILQANPGLTWRDVQHIITQGAMLPNVQQDGWQINGAGFHVNHMFGFGVLDAGKMVKLALTWEPVSEQLTCEVKMHKYNMKVSMGKAKNATYTVDKCSHIEKLEHTIAHVSFLAPRRGNIGLRLISPSGTPSQILSTRPNDHTDEGLEKWPFMTVHNWGENPAGEWILEMTNNMPSEKVLEDFKAHKGKDDDDDEEDDGFLDLVPRLTKAAIVVEWGFTFYGTGTEKNRKDDNVEVTEDNPAINPEQAGPADQETVIDIWNDEQADDEEIHIDPEELSPDADIPPNIENNFEDGKINTGAFNGQLADDDMQKMGTKKKKKILAALLLLETREIQEKLRDLELQDEYARVQDAIFEYRKNVGGAQLETQNRNSQPEQRRLDISDLKRAELLLLLRELEEDLKK